MNREKASAAGRKRMLALGMTALLSVVAHAADPNTVVPKEQTKAPTAPLPPGAPKSPALRTPAALTRQTPLSEAIDILRNSTAPPLNIIVLWKPLGDAGIYRDTPIGIDGLGSLRAGQCLELLMLSLSAGASARLGYAVDRGIITVSTLDTLPAPRPVARIYDIRDLVAPPARYSLASQGFGSGYGGPMTPGPGYTGNPARNPSTPVGSPYRNTGPSPRNYRR